MPDRVLIKVNANRRVTEELTRLGLPIFVRTEKMVFRRTQERVSQAARAGRSATAVRRSDQRHKRGAVDSGCQIFGNESIADVNVTEIFRELWVAGYTPIKAHGLIKDRQQPVRLVVQWASDMDPKDALREAEQTLERAKRARHAIPVCDQDWSLRTLNDYRRWQNQREKEFKRNMRAWREAGRNKSGKPRPRRKELSPRDANNIEEATKIDAVRQEFHRAEKTITAHKVGQEIMSPIVIGRRESIGHFYQEITKVSFARCDLYANPRSGENGEGPLIHTVNLGGERSPLAEAKHTLHFGRGLWGVNEFVP